MKKERISLKERNPDLNAKYVLQKFIKSNSIAGIKVRFLIEYKRLREDKKYTKEMAFNKLDIIRQNNNLPLSIFDHRISLSLI